MQRLVRVVCTWLGEESWFLLTKSSHEKKIVVPSACRLTVRLCACCVSGFLDWLEGEKDPRCLILCLRTLAALQVYIVLLIYYIYI
jgi:hypothetical protein